MEESSAAIQGTLVVGAFSHNVNGVFDVVSEESGEGEPEADAGAVAIKSRAPMVIRISTLGMGERLNALMQLCGHQSIADAVEVSAQGTISIAEME